MSKEKPEAGDLWEFKNKRRLFITCVTGNNCYSAISYMDDFDNHHCTISLRDFQDVVDVGDLKYLGKSKVDINQLFEVDDGREFTGLYDKFGKKIMFGDVVHWTDGGDELSLEERIKTRWDRIAVVRKLYGAEVNFKVIDSPSKKVIEYDMDFDFGSFIYQDTKKYLTVVAESEKEYFDKFKTAGECMKLVLDREVQDE